MSDLPDLILFGDRHYGAWPARAQAELLRPLCRLTYIEEDYAALAAALAAQPRAALAFNSIAGTPGNATVPAELEAPLRRHLEAGNDLWLLHGGSAALWPWAWWRELMPLRWVRGSDPDGKAPSTHPIVPLRLRPTASGLAGCPGLRREDLPADELYIRLAEQGPHEVWLMVEHEGVEWPQAYVAKTPWGGRLRGFIPGHAASVLGHPGYAEIFTCLAKAWLARAMSG
jgi:hypothetical protein